MLATLLSPLLLMATPDESVCRPRGSEGLAISVDERFAHVTLDRFMDTYFSEAFNNGAAPVMGIKSRTIVDEHVAGDGSRERRTRMRPSLTLPGPLRVFASEEQLKYDEVSSYDAAKHQIRFFVASEACDQMQYGGVIRFIEEGDGVRLHIDARLHVTAPLVGGIVEQLVQGGVKDGYAKHHTFMQRWLDNHAPKPPGADATPNVALSAR